MNSKLSIIIDDKLPNIHPGEILSEEFLKPMNISAYRLAKAIRIPQTRISDIIHGKRRITADTALRFAAFFGTSTRFWLGLQNAYDVEEEIKKQADELQKIESLHVPEPVSVETVPKVPAY
ncbi:HigA family addiction module antidote protein [Treponema sp. OMZ 840]|uniref:HigA family addiction module antitoxin n=1 Tax=Treponema sp. OMZ 840 TaxID=244313 RepID=UPI003D90377E